MILSPSTKGVRMEYGVSHINDEILGSCLPEGRFIKVESSCNVGDLRESANTSALGAAAYLELKKQQLVEV
ncbi:hypothetical protein Tco_1090823 [Tanacetum coccineum]|uniref:Uncharacterized protein n=1 Tax=Tanacetum coccineum TaxID=301880 RepID=A0ABQ5I5E6_9ASTR